MPRADNYRGVPLHLNAHLPLVRLGVVDAQPIEAELAPDSQRSVKGEEMLARINGAHLVYAHQPVIARFAAAVIVQRPCDSLVTDNLAQILLEVIFRFFFLARSVTRRIKTAITAVTADMIIHT